MKGFILGQQVFEELQSSAFQVSLLQCDGVVLISELLLQLLQLLQVLTDLLQTLRYCREPAGGRGQEIR